MGRLIARVLLSAKSAADYRERAEELRELAAFGRGDELDQELLDLAEEYDALAEIADGRLTAPHRHICHTEISPPSNLQTQPDSDHDGGKKGDD